MRRPRRSRTHHERLRASLILLAAALLLPACINGNATGGPQTVAMIPNYKGGGVPEQARPNGYTPASNVITVDLGDTSPTSMFIHLSQTYAPAGPVTFLINNTSTTMDHELVGFLSKTMAGAYPVTSFEGVANKIDENKAGVSVIDTGAALKPGTSQMLTVNMKSGHYSLVCNLVGHYKAGMHVDFWVTPKGSTPVTVDLGDTSPTSMFIHLSQTYAPAGPVTFLINNTSTTMDHELVGFLSKTMAGAYPVTSFEGVANKIDENKAGVSVIDTGAALKPGTSQMLTVNMKSGHYSLVCNLVGHYKAGMHVDFWVTPKGSTPVTVDLGDTSPTSMFIHLSQTYAPAGPVTFLINNTSTTMDHELVGFLSKTMAGAYPVTSFEGVANKIDENKAGVSVIDTGAALKPGTSQMLTVNMKSGHYSLVCNLVGHYKAGMHVDFWVTPKGSTPVTVDLGDTSPTSMFIHLSQTYAPAGPVTFLINNTSTTMDHELVGFLSKTMAGAYPVTSFEGVANKIDENKAGVSVIDTGAALKPGTSQMLTVNMKSGHYSLVCNLVGHYKAGMHVDFWVTPKGSTPVTVDLGDTSPTSMFIHLSQTYAPAGPVTFLINNTSTTMDHELVGFLSKTMAGAYPVTSFEGVANKIDENKAGVSVIDTGAALKPGTSQMLTVNMKSGHYSLVCNLVGHYKAGMHVDFWVSPS